jgi:hypothetical protein
MAVKALMTMLEGRIEGDVVAFSDGSLMEGIAGAGVAEGNTQPFELSVVDPEVLTQLFPPRSLRLPSSFQSHRGQRRQGHWKCESRRAKRRR